MLYVVGLFESRAQLAPGKHMPRFKVLKGVAHNIGHSFTSLMNYSGDDYSMGHILKFSRETGDTTLTIDFMTGLGSPESLLREPISKLPAWYSQMFWNMVKSSGSSRELLQSARLTLAYDLTRVWLDPTMNVHISPYVCNVVLVDIRGKSYSAHFAGSWYEESGLHRSLISRARKYINQFARRLFKRSTDKNSLN